jgi:O-antigen/teichoic acid export membrane protein
MAVHANSVSLMSLRPLSSSIATEADVNAVADSPGAGRSLLSGATFALANAAQRTLTFILLPLYTAVLSPAEYGRLGLLLTVQSGASVAFAAGMEIAILRGFFLRESDVVAQRRFVLSTWKFIFILTPILALGASVAVVALTSPSSVFRPNEAVLAIWAAAVFVSATVVPFTVLRAEQRLHDYVVVTATTGITTAALTVLAVVVLRLGVGGWFIATLLANVVTLVVVIHLTPWRRVNGFDTQGVREAIALAVPLIPHAGSQWSLQLADRILLATLVSASRLGVYTLGAILALPALVIVQSLNYGFLPVYGRSPSRANASAALRSTITLQVLLVLLTCCGLSIIGGPLVSFISPAYAGAADLIPWLVLGSAFLGFYYIPMNTITLVVGRTTFIWVMTITAAAINLGAIAIFVPQNGIMAAAVASALGYGALLVLVSGYAIVIGVRLDINWSRILSMIAVTAVIFAISEGLPSNASAIALLTRTGLLLTLPITLTAAGGYSITSGIGFLRGLVATSN